MEDKYLYFSVSDEKRRLGWSMLDFSIPDDELGLGSSIREQSIQNSSSSIILFLTREPFFCLVIFFVK